MPCCYFYFLFSFFTASRGKITATSCRVVHRANARLHSGHVAVLHEKAHPPQSVGTPTGSDKVSQQTVRLLSQCVHEIMSKFQPSDLHTRLYDLRTYER